jgi:hypothetical protein
VLAVGYLLDPDLRIEDFERLCPEQRDLSGMLEKAVLKAKGAARAVVYAFRIKAYDVLRQYRDTNRDISCQVRAGLATILRHD